MPAYEYHHESFYFRTDSGFFSGETVDDGTVQEWTDRCNELGLDGWRLMAVVPIDPRNSVPGSFAIYTFMRPLPDAGPA